MALKKAKILQNEIGQFFTPYTVADKMAKLCKKHINKPVNTFLDPAVGKGIFFKVAFENGLIHLSTKNLFYDIDERVLSEAGSLADHLNLKCNIHHEDYLKSSLTKSADLVIMNPPYIRQEKIPQTDKDIYLQKLQDTIEVSFSRKSNLYVYFLFKTIADLNKGGIGCAILYDAIEQSRYGQQTLEKIKELVDIKERKSVKAPFQDALVDASILVFKKRSVRKKSSAANFNFTDSLSSEYKQLVSLDSLADIKRGTTLLNSKVFIADKRDPYYEKANSIIKKQRYIDNLVVSSGHPEKAYLYSEGESLGKNLTIWLKEKATSIDKNNKTLNRKMAKKSNEWFYHTKYNPPIIFNYYIRNNPRHLLNVDGLPVADNFYGISPNDFSIKVAWLLLNSEIYLNCILSNSRSQGNGLRKLQLYEYRNAKVPDWNTFEEKKISEMVKMAERAISKGGISDSIKKELNSLLINKFKK
jgi:predicted RNA methylase